MRPTVSQNGKQARNRKRAKARLRLLLVLSAGSLILFVCILLLLPAAFGNTGGTADKPSALGVTSITVEGNTRYDEEAVLGVSGIEVGQSIFSLNRRKAANALKKEFHYFEDVKVKIDLSRNVTIHVTEAVPMGAVYAEGQWVVVSHEGIGLQATPVTTERPLRQLYIKGAGVLGATPGEQVLDDASLDIVAQIFDALQAVGLENICVVDIENRADIRLNWNNQITILLGNDTNLRYEIAAAASALPKVFEKHGDTATGLLNVSQYADPTIASPAIVFTPSSLLEQEEPEAEPQPETD